MDIALLIL